MRIVKNNYTNQKMKTTNQFLITLLVWIGLCSLTQAQVAVQVGSIPKQTMRYGMDYERLWYWTNSLTTAEKDLVSQWSVVDNDIDFIRVAINSGYELTEGDYDLSAYTNKIIPMMKDMQDANPDIKFFASPRPLDEAMNNVSWQPYPQWITGSSGSNSNFSFNWEKCAEYLVRYIELMDSYGLEISYLDLTNEWNYITSTHVRDIAEYLEDDLTGKGLTMPQVIAPSTWSYAQGASWLNSVNTKRRRDAIDIVASHNTDPGGSAEAFVERSHDILGTKKEIWNTELHDWKSTGGYDEVLTFSYMMEAINAGFSGLTGWLAIGTKNQGHCYILNPSGTPSRNVKYFIFNKLTNTSHRGQALDIETPRELSHTTALIKDNLLTVWAVNPNNSSVDISIDLTDYTSTNQTITRTYWNTDSDVEGVVSNYLSTNSSSISGTVPAGSLSCFEITLDTQTPPTTIFTPDPNKTYYIDSPIHNVRLAATGASEDAYTTSISTTGSDVVWQFVAKGNGSWHLQRAAGGFLPRLRTDNSANADMQSNDWNGTYTYYDMEATESGNTYFFTLPDGPNDFKRLQVDPNGDVRMVPSSYNGSWESFTITETGFVSGGSTIVHITKRNAIGFAIDGGNGGSDGQNVKLWSADTNNVNQQWLETDRGNGYYSYQKVGTDYCIDGGRGGANNQNVYLWNCDDSNQNQQWQKVAVSGGAFKLIKRNASDYTIDGGSGGVNDQSIELYDSSSNHENLQWFITSLGASVRTPEEIASQYIQIYPNPVINTVTILGGSGSAARVYDINGKLLLTQNITKDSATIDMSALAKGMYYLKMIGLQEKSVMKILKE